MTKDMTGATGDRSAGRRAILIDDNPEWSGMIESFLIEKGYRVHVYSDGEEGLKAVLGQRPDLVVLEFLLPGIDGFTICQTVRNDKDVGSTPILMTTSAYLTPKELENGVELGETKHFLTADAFLNKPFDRGELENMVEAVVDKRAPRKVQDKVLVVDDTTSVVELVKVRLENDFDVITAFDGQDALEKVRAGDPDLVLLDIQMPVLDGISTLEILRQERPGLAIVMMTAYGSEEVAIEAMKKGADDYLTKPLNTRELPGQVRENLRKRRLNTINESLTRQLKEVTKALIRKYKDIEQIVADRTEELKRRTDQLVQSEKMAAVGTLAAGVAHEINTPLTNISLYAQMLRDANDDGGLSKYIDVVLTNVKSAARIVAGLLEFSRQSEMQKVNCDMNTVIDKSLDLMLHQLELDSIAVERHYAEGLPLLPLDQGRMQQVFLNLVINAHHALKGVKGPKVRISTERTVVAGREFILVTVRDNGTGIPEDKHERVFEPFFTTKETGAGTGLGLAICKGIVEAHDGMIDFRSGPGEGTSFLIHLPLDQE